MKLMRLLKNKNGVSMVIFTITVTLIMGIGALVTDVGLMAVEKTKFQNAIDAATLAAAAELPNEANALNVANQYIQLNGYSPSDVSITFPDGNVKIVGTKNIDFYFARIFGINNADTIVSSTAQIDTLGEAFNYALFSGSEIDLLTLNGSNMYIDGDTHTNMNFVSNGAQLTITGTCEAKGTITTVGSQINIGARVTNAPYVAMPDFSDQIKVLAQTNGTYFEGSKTYSGSNNNVDHSIYVTGNITVNGSQFSGKGCIVAEGDIIFNGSNLYSSNEDAVCFYSKNGNIIINGSNIQLNGIAYAPNGCVLVNGSNQTVNGRVIGNDITFNGSGLTVISSRNDITSLPTHGVKLIK